MNVEKTNLNLLPVLHALLSARSVSGAAALLGRSASAVSESLARLRLLLGDQLLVRQGGPHLQLTPRAVELATRVGELQDKLEALFSIETFDPSASTRCFTFASSDLMIHQVAPLLVQISRLHAPKISFSFVDISRGLTEKMASRELDFALLPEFAITDLAPSPIRFVALYDLRLVALMSRDNELAGNQSVSIQQLRALRHLTFQPHAVLLEGRRRLPASGVETYSNLSGFDHAVTVSQFLTIPRLLEKTDLVAIVPAPVAEVASHQDSSVASIELSDASASGRMGIAWSPVHDRDPAHAWLRKRLRSACRSAALDSDTDLR